MDEFANIIPEESKPQYESTDNNIFSYNINLTNSEEIEKSKEMQEFLKNHKNKDINMSVMFYMVWALQKLYNLSKDKLQPIAFEIAQVGIWWIDPQEDWYTLSMYPKHIFSGYELLSYYYVSWKLLDEALHSKLQLPFDKEYELALKFYLLWNKNVTN